MDERGGVGGSGSGGWFDDVGVEETVGGRGEGFVVEGGGGGPMGEVVK